MGWKVCVVNQRHPLNASPMKKVSKIVIKKYEVY